MSGPAHPHAYAPMRASHIPPCTLKIMLRSMRHMAAATRAEAVAAGAEALTEDGAAAGGVLHEAAQVAQVGDNEKTDAP